MAREFPLPGSRPQYAADRDVDIQHVRIAVDVNLEARAIRGRCSLTFGPVGEGVRRVRLDAVELDIAGVTLGGAALAYRYDGAVLDIDLGRELRAYERVAVDVDYATTPRRGLYFVVPDDAYPDKPTQVWTQGQDRDSRYWFPCVDTPLEKATSEVIATVPASMFAVSNGQLLRDEVQGDRRTVHWRLDVPHSAYLVTLAAGEFARVSEAWEDVEIAYYGAPGTEDALRRTAGRTPEMIELFSRMFRCRYPYGKYDQIFVADFIFGGMENTSATSMTDLVLLDERAALDYDAQTLVAHELAHQWFGDLLTCRTWSEGWLNEGFATYAEYLWRAHAEGPDAADLELDDWGRQYFEEVESRYRRPIVCNVYHEPIDIFDHHLYEKGGRVLHMLRRHLGDDAFWTAIGHYLDKHRTGSVETRDLARAVEESTGRALDWFFAQWIHRSGHPELEVTWSWNEERRCAVLAVAQTQATGDGDAPLYRLPARVRLRVGGDDRDIPIEIREARHSFAFPLSAPPEQAIFDPEKVLLAAVKTDKGLDLWRAELEGAAAAIDRVHAARELGRRGGAQAREALAAALVGDPFWGVQAEAADALAQIRTPAARDALKEAGERDLHPRARRAVMRALGAFRGDDAAAESLARVVEAGDDSYFVEAEACLSLGKTRTSRAPELLRGAIDRTSFMDIIRQFAYRGLAEARDESALPILLARTRYGHHSLGRRAALLAAAQLAAGRRDRAAREVRERGEELLRDSDFRTQGAAIEALRTIGDPASIPALRALIDRELDGRLRRRAREVIRDLEEGTAAAEQTQRLRDQVEELRAELRSLRERVDVIEPPERAASAAAKPPPTRRKGGKKTIPT